MDWKSIIEPKIILNKPKDLIHVFNKVNTFKERKNKQIQIDIQCNVGRGGGEENIK